MEKPKELGSTVLTSQREFQAEHGGESPSNVKTPRGQGKGIRAKGRTEARQYQKGKK